MGTGRGTRDAHGSVTKGRMRRGQRSSGYRAEGSAVQCRPFVRLVIFVIVCRGLCVLALIRVIRAQCRVHCIMIMLSLLHAFIHPHKPRPRPSQSFSECRDGGTEEG